MHMGPFCLFGATFYVQDFFHLLSIKSKWISDNYWPDFERILFSFLFQLFFNQIMFIIAAAGCSHFRSNPASSISTFLTTKGSIYLLEFFFVSVCHKVKNAIVYAINVVFYFLVLAPWDICPYIHLMELYNNLWPQFELQNQQYNQHYILVISLATYLWRAFGTSGLLVWVRLNLELCKSTLQNLPCVADWLCRSASTGDEGGLFGPQVHNGS